jgi:hypothetical protein
MPAPRIISISPNFTLGVPVDFVVLGQGFLTEGTQGNVTMTTSTPGILWTVNQVKVLDAQRIRVNATPGLTKAARARLKDFHPTSPPGGVGDLTTTVTNGDGTMSAPQAQTVSYTAN